MVEASAVSTKALTCDVQGWLLERNRICAEFFAREAQPLTVACHEMSERFLRGGRLLAFGQGPYATDAQHVSVEFVHPIIAGKRALPALDLSANFERALETLLGPDDIVMGFAPPEGDTAITAALAKARKSDAMTFALPGAAGADFESYAFKPPTQHPFIHQELTEILYHTLWETVHVFFEQRELGCDAGDAGFLYPFLSDKKQGLDDVNDPVATSIRCKAQEDASLRTRLAQEESETIVHAAQSIHQRLAQGGKLIIFGNGGSATDANDFAIDCVCPPAGYRPLPAISLSMEPASLTAIANDVGIELIFLRQMIAHARKEDVAIGISTSGGSRNIILALEEARKRGLLTVALLGNDGGEISRRNLVDLPIVVRSDYIPRIQEVQASAYHVIRELLEVLARA